MRITSLALLFAVVVSVPAAAQASPWRWRHWHHWHHSGHWDRWHRWVEVNEDVATYGAIAFSDSTARFGISWDRLSPEAAQQAAISACGVGDCTARVIEQDQYAVLARGTGGTVGAWNDDLATAQQAALAACSTKGTNCTIVATTHD
jgi:hypothetical protein